MVCFGDENREAFTHNAAVDLAGEFLFELEMNFVFGKWRELKEDLLEMGVFRETRDVRDAMRDER